MLSAETQSESRRENPDGLTWPTKLIAALPRIKTTKIPQPIITPMKSFAI
jgi:hypothetical protein